MLVLNNSKFVTKPKEKGKYQKERKKKKREDKKKKNLVTKEKVLVAPDGRRKRLHI